MSNRVAGRITPATRNGFGKNFARFIRPIHPSVGDRQTKCRTTADVLRFLVKRDCFVEASHFTIERGQERLAKNKCGGELQRAFARSYRFIVETEIAIELASGVVHPKRGRIDRGSAL